MTEHAALRPPEPLVFPSGGVLPVDKRPTYPCGYNWQHALLALGRLPRSTVFLGAGPVERPDDGYVTLLRQRASASPRGTMI